MSLESKIIEVAENSHSQLLLLYKTNSFKSTDTMVLDGEIVFSSGKIKSRSVIGVQTLLPYKFLDLISWDDSKKKAIVIGYNPSLSNINKLDKTNKNVVEVLNRSDYGGYYLLNVYPVVSPDPDDVDDNTVNTKFVNGIVDILEKNLQEKENLDVVIIWGRTLKPYVHEGLYKKLYETANIDRLYSTTIDGKIVHASARGKKQDDMKLTKVGSVSKGSVYINLNV